MKVKLLATGETATFNDGYAMRLIEQGKAAAVAEEAPAEAEEPAKTTGGKKK